MVSEKKHTEMLVWATHKEGDVCVSIHMPRWASRITLEIINVRVERLEKISEDDANAEGCEQSKCDHPDCDDHVYGYRAAYAILWNKINGKKFPWGSKPWVWVLEFKKL